MSCGRSRHAVSFDQSLAAAQLRRKLPDKAGPARWCVPQNADATLDANLASLSSRASAEQADERIVGAGVNLTVLFLPRSGRGQIAVRWPWKSDILKPLFAIDYRQVG